LVAALKDTYNNTRIMLTFLSHPFDYIPFAVSEMSLT